MKTRLFLMAMAGVALAGCVSEEVADVKSQEQAKVKIAFESPVTYNNSYESRANYHGEIGSTTEGLRVYPDDEDFIIYAVKYNDDIEFPGWVADNNSSDVEYALFNAETVKYDYNLDGWIPTKPTGDDPYYYWPEGKKLAYAASSPADLEQASGWNGRKYDATGLTLTDFKVPANAANHFDLLFSKRHIDITKDDMLMSADHYSGAPIVFQHALSSIHFSLANSSESTEIVLKRISLYGVIDTGTFKENISTENFTEYERGDNGNVKPEWTIKDDAVKISEEQAYVAFEAGENPGLTFPVNPQYISTLLTHENNKNAGENHVLLILPQDLTESALLRVDYEVKNGNNTTNAHKVVPLKGAKKWDPDKKVITDEEIEKWEIGTKYTYRLVYSKDAAKKDKIYFSPSTEVWKDAGVFVIDLANAMNVEEE